jgi:hypothetical protein
MSCRTVESSPLEFQTTVHDKGCRSSIRQPSSTCSQFTKGKMLHVPRMAFHFYVSGGLTPHQIAAFETHVSKCEVCRQTLTTVMKFVTQFAIPSRKARRDARARRRERKGGLASWVIARERISGGVFLERFQVEILEGLTNIIRVRSPRPLPAGIAVHLQRGDGFLSGQVRYCVEWKGSFDVCIQVERRLQVEPRKT